jgi:uncharacterized membrane protein YqiK
MLEILMAFWWIIPILLALLFYKKVMRFFGIVIIPEDKIGLVTKVFRFYGGPNRLPEGRIIAINGEAGLQATTLSPGIHFLLYPWKYKIHLQELVVIPINKLGLITAKDGQPIPPQSILGKYVESDSFQDATSFLKNGGQKGRQAAYITAGSYKINTTLFEIQVCPLTQIAEDKVGIVTVFDGSEIKKGDIAGKIVNSHNNFQSPNKFIENDGNRGLQIQHILAGTYNINPWFAKVEQVDMTSVPIGYVGVCISYVGEEGKDLSGEDFKHGNIVENGFKGVWNKPLDPGKYPINTFIQKVELVPTTNIVLNWANNRNESHKLDENLSTITVRSKDGFAFNLDVSQIIHIPSSQASRVISRFGSVKNLVTQVLEPTIGNYFRNSAQDSDVIDFLTERKQRQDEAKKTIEKVLIEYNINSIDSLIGDIVPPPSLMQTLTERKIAFEQEKTFENKKLAEIKRQDFEKQKSIADMQNQVVVANQGVEIAEKNAQQKIKEAEGNAKSITLNAEANAKRLKFEAEGEAAKITQIGDAKGSAILAEGESNAKSYHLAVDAMGSENFTKLKIINAIAEGKVQLMPKVLQMGNNGSGNGSVDALLGLNLLKELDPTALKAE